MNQNNIFFKALTKKDPMEYITNLAQHNKDAADFMQIANGFMGKDPGQQEQFLRGFCQQNNINFDEALQQFKIFFNK